MQNVVTRSTDPMLSSIVAVDRSLPSPPYRQIQVDLTRAINSGALAAGTRLPTVRALATDLDVAVNTVAKAFRALEQAGLVITRGRAGTVVAPLDRPTSKLESLAQQYADFTAELGVSGAEALTVMESVLRRRGMME